MSAREVVIRDPVHGTMPVTYAELRLIDHVAFQRLRSIKQLGFADLAFPGATHSRYSHSLGAMHVATRIFDRLLRPGDLPERVFTRFRQTVRLAMLLHDVGHAPLSHTTEMLMPPVGELGLGHYAGDDVSRQATHEDYTLKIILDSSLGELMEREFSASGILPADVVELILGQTWEGQSTRFRHGGCDYGPMLRQIVSSECDADRMDYLQRDSFYAGVNYGKFDVDWLVDNVCPVQRGSSVFMGIRSRAIFSFEDFLLSRFHMFATVYLHYTPVIFERMLGRYLDNCDGEFELPADVERYVGLDDVDLWYTLRRSKNLWAKRVVERRPYALLDERNEQVHMGTDEVQNELCDRLAAEKIDVIRTRSKSVLSKYIDSVEKQPIYVVTGTGEEVSLDDYTPLYSRYAVPASLSRVYVDPQHKTRARAILTDTVDAIRPPGHVDKSTDGAAIEPD